MTERVINFGAGPSPLPTSVLEKAAQALVNFDNTGIGIAEISHRSKEWGAFMPHLESLIRDQLAVPPTHVILFAQGGGTAQFGAVVLNMLARHRLLQPELRDEERVLDYVITGSWSKAAREEAVRLGGGSTIRIAADSRTHSANGKFDNIPPHEAYSFTTANPAMIYYCENETVAGVQFSSDDASPTSFPYHLLPRDTLVPLVADYSSSFISRPIPHLADHAVIYAGAQKNLGPAGVTILIVRKDCLVDVDAATKLGAIPVPITMSWKTLADSGSMFNTPPVLSMYICGLVLERMKELGGLTYFEEFNRNKSSKLYAALEDAERMGIMKVKVNKNARSAMNVTFDVLGEGADERFLKGAAEQGMRELKGHRSVGGMRASLYNAVTEEQVDRLVQYIKDFVLRESSGSTK